jgi:serine/threonine-protein kinase RsbW
VIKASITVHSDRDELSRLQAFASDFAHQAALPNDERSRLLIILEELFTNAVAYGYRPDSGNGSVTVALRLTDGRLAISFVDDGERFDPLSATVPDLDAAGRQRAVGGLGLHIVRSLVHQARYRWAGGRNHLHLVRRLPTLSAADD